MQNTFTQKMQALRQSMDASLDARHQRLSALRHDVTQLRRSTRGFLDGLRVAHHATTEQVQSSLAAMREQRRELNDDMRRGGAILRAPQASLG
jgi:hypothetical protein